MSDPTALPFQDDDRPGTAPEDSIYEGQRPERAGGEPTGSVEADGPSPSETDRLASQVSGPDDQVGMTSLWRLTMSLDHWWFIAVGEEGLESPAAATIDDQLMVLTFTAADRARDFAVQNGMIGPDEDLRAIALPPREVVESAETYRQAGIGGLMFDPHIAGYFIPTGQLPVVWDAVYSTADGVDPVGGTDAVQANPPGQDGEAGRREG